MKFNIVYLAPLFVLLVLFLNTEDTKSEFTTYLNLLPKSELSGEKTFIIKNQNQEVKVILRFVQDGDWVKVYIGDKQQGALCWTERGIIDSGGDMLVPRNDEIASEEGVVIVIDSEVVTFTKYGIHAVSLKSDNTGIKTYSVKGVTMIATD